MYFFGNILATNWTSPRYTHEDFLDNDDPTNICGFVIHSYIYLLISLATHVGTLLVVGVALSYRLHGFWLPCRLNRPSLPCLYRHTHMHMYNTMQVAVCLCACVSIRLYLSKRHWQWQWLSQFFCFSLSLGIVSDLFNK